MNSDDFIKSMLNLPSAKRTNGTIVTRLSQTILRPILLQKFRDVNVSFTFTRQDLFYFLAVKKLSLFILCQHDSPTGNRQYTGQGPENNSGNNGNIRVRIAIESGIACYG